MFHVLVSPFFFFFFQFFDDPRYRSFYFRGEKEGGVTHENFRDINLRDIKNFIGIEKVVRMIFHIFLQNEKISPILLNDSEKTTSKNLLRTSV